MPKKLSPSASPCLDRGQSRPLRRHRDQIQTQGQDPHRLSAQWTRPDRRDAVFDARARRFECRFNRRYDLTTIIPRLGWVATRTLPMPYRLFKLAEGGA